MRAMEIIEKAVLVVVPPLLLLAMIYAGVQAADREDEIRRQQVPDSYRQQVMEWSR